MRQGPDHDAQSRFARLAANPPSPVRDASLRRSSFHLALPPLGELKRLARLSVLRGGRDPPWPCPEERAAAAQALASADAFDGDSFLMLGGDKRFIWSASGGCVQMYGLHGRTWIAMGAPVGRACEQDEVVAAFLSRAAAAGAQPAWHNVSPRFADRLRAAGLKLAKIGERAEIDLAAFSLTGKSNRGLRNALNQAERSGCTFEVRPPGAALELASELRGVSDAWLARQPGSELGFSLGRFDPTYLARFHLALVRREGRLIAFSNVWTHRDLATCDLMRFADEGPGGGMTHMQLRLLLWAQQQGFARFDLGLAPLAGLEAAEMEGWIGRAGAFVFQHGGALYRFRGVRDWKNKFAPRWEPVFIAARSRAGLARAALGVARLTQGRRPRRLSFEPTWFRPRAA